MEQENFNQLRNIKRIEVSEMLYDKISQRIAYKKANLIPLYKVNVAACLLFALVIGQVFILSQSKNTNTNPKNQLVEINNNMLYNE